MIDKCGNFKTTYTVYLLRKKDNYFHEITSKFMDYENKLCPQTTHMAQITCYFSFFTGYLLNNSLDFNLNILGDKISFSF